ncbi:hypothetical protein KKI24_11710 [bacterium]|nr:hypothetical protein [bacterium]
MKIKTTITCLILIIINPILSFGLETITGYACYRYSDNESINEARDIALSMAKREALEKYQVFVASTTTVENSVLMNDLISSLSAGVLKNLRITKKTEDLDKKNVCREITAEVEPVEIKQRIVSKINVYKQKHSNFQSGLPENERLKVLKVMTVAPHTSDYIGALKIVVKCKIKNWPVMRLTYYDKDGIPEGMYKQEKTCSHIGDIVIYHLNYKTPDYSFEIID